MVRYIFKLDRAYWPGRGFRHKGRGRLYEKGLGEEMVDAIEDGLRKIGVKAKASTEDEVYYDVETNEEIPEETLIGLRGHYRGIFKEVELTGFEY